MLHAVEPVPALDAAERFALETILDLSRVVIADGGASVELRVVGEAASVTVAQARGGNWGVRGGHGRVELQRSTLRLIADIAGAVAEQRSTAADRYGRVPPSVNALVALGLERDPIVHHAAKSLREAAAGAATGAFALLAPWPDGRRWAMAMSHDLDVVSLWPAFTALRVLELLKKGDVGRATSVLASAAGSALGDPVLESATQVLAVERAHGVRSTWFIITGTPTFSTVRAGDVTYTPETPRARRIVAAAGDAGHEIGLHGSFETYVTAAAFTRQRDRLRAIANRDIAGVRQHFLRMRPGESHRAMTDAGFDWDSTHGFPDRNGFRLGTADVTRVWDESTREVLELDEVPFVWMDRALSKYQGVEAPSAWVDEALAIAGICRAVEGVWNGIWHPNLAPALGYPGASAAYVDLVQRLVGLSPWSATMTEIVGWRRARRAARAAGLDAAGRVRLKAGDPRVTLEDAAGNALPSVAA
jgi:hypothetical protein